MLRRIAGQTLGEQGAAHLKALPGKIKERLFLWGMDLRDNSLSVVSGWAYRNVSWADLPNSILPRTELKAEEQSLARKGRKGWISPGSEMTSGNLDGEVPHP